VLDKEIYDISDEIELEKKTKNNDIGYSSLDEL